MSLYLDNNSTALITPENARIIKEAVDEMVGKSGNPSAAHHAGHIGKDIITRAADSVRLTLDCKPTDEVVFTSGATESINMAIVGSTTCFVRLSKEVGKSGVYPHIIISSIEHPATLAACEYCERMFNASISILKVDNKGIIDEEDLERALISGRTCCVSFAHGSNEIGTIQYNVNKIFTLIKRKCSYGSYAYLNKQSFGESMSGNIIGMQKDGNNVTFPGFPVCHLDCTQTVGKTLFSFTKTNADCISFTGHKICGVGGIGGFIIKGSTFIDGAILPTKIDGTSWPNIVTCFVPIDRVLHGSLQQNGRRPGTEPVLLINILGRAMQELRKQNNVNNSYNIRLQSLTRKILHFYNTFSSSLLYYGIKTRLNGYLGYLYEEVCDKNIDQCVQYSGIMYLPNTLSITIYLFTNNNSTTDNNNDKYITSQDIVKQCDLKGIAMLSAGSACSNLEAQTNNGSTVLKSLGFTNDEANSTLRISFPMDIENETYSDVNINKTAKAIADTINEMR